MGPPSRRHYLDGASSAPLRPAVRGAVLAALEVADGDPSRLHHEAMSARAVLEEARSDVATAFGARPREVVFTASASEAIAMAVRGARAADPDGVVITTAVEHSAVSATAAATGDTEVVDVDAEGRVDADALADRIERCLAAGRSVALVAVQAANHELGTIQPIDAVVAHTRRLGVRSLVDAAQSAPWTGIDFGGSGADFCAISGAKLGAGGGTGTLLIRRGVRVPPLVLGGHQERSRRAGVESTIGAAALAAAAVHATDECELVGDRVAGLTTTLRAELAGIEGLEILGPAEPARRLPHITSVSLPDLEPQPVLIGLDQRGVAVHSGSSCSSEALDPSPVLAAIGADAEHGLRFSLHWASDEEDVRAAVSALHQVVTELRSLRT